ncbi:hypothetical protein C8R45DRAFT_1100566 [Mycena sanguinolenta]|nr:hypothetical protein C8R45DRAFT_1100566 [Mycena sanguinolenta]
MSYASALAYKNPDLPTQPSRIHGPILNGSAEATIPGEQPATTSPQNAAPSAPPPGTANASASGEHPPTTSPPTTMLHAAQELSPTPAANPPGLAAGSAARCSALDGLSAEEQACRRAAIGRSGTGGTGRSGTGRSGPVANSRALSKPERKERQEKWEAELLEVAARHEVTVKELLEKYPEKGEANIRKLLTHASSLQPSRKLTLRNALLHDLCLKSKEESSTGKGRSSIEITEELGAEAIHEMMENLEEHERVELLEQLAEHRATQRHGMRKTDKAQAAYVRQKLEKAQKELDALYLRTGTRTMMWAVHSNTHDPNEPTFIETGGSRDFLNNYMGKSCQEIGHNYEMWSVAKGRGESKSNSMVTVRSEISKEVHAKLRIAMGKKDAKMSWTHYEIDVCEALKVKLVGWLVTQTDADGNVMVKMGPLNQLPSEIARQTLKGLKNGTIFFVDMPKAEHDALVTKHAALCAANGPLKKRATHSDAGEKHASRKRKATGDDEEDEEEEEESGEGSAQHRDPRKKRRTAQNAPADTSSASNALSTPNTSTVPNTLTVPNASTVLNASTTPNASTALNALTALNASTAPDPSTTPNTPTPPNTVTALETPNTPNAVSTPRKKAKKKKTKDAMASTRTRPVPRPRRSQPAVVSAPGTNTLAANNMSYVAPTLRLPSPEPLQATHTSAAAPTPSIAMSGPSPESRAFGAPGPDFWGLPQGGSVPEMALDSELMSFLGEAVGGHQGWGPSATGSSQVAGGGGYQDMGLPPSVRAPAVPPQRLQLTRACALYAYKRARGPQEYGGDVGRKRAPERRWRGSALLGLWPLPCTVPVHKIPRLRTSASSTIYI